MIKPQPPRAPLRIIGRHLVGGRTVGFGHLPGKRRHGDAVFFGA